MGKISATDLNGTTWTLVDLDFDQQPTMPDTEVSISFQDWQITGSGGCNTYNSSFSLDDLNPGAMTISPIAATRKACPELILNQEMAYFTALEGVSQWGYHVGQLTLFYQNDQGDFGTLIFAPPATEPVEMLTASTWQWVRLTGTVVGVADRIAPYGCPDGTYLFEDFQQGQVWLAEKAVIGLNDDGFFVEQSEMVSISRIWQ